MLHIPWVFISISTVLTFILLLVLVRWIGSTQLTQLTFFNWVAGASMGNIAANMITTNSRSVWIMNGFTLTLFTLCAIVAAIIALKSRRFRLLANGQPIVLIHHGKILRQQMRLAKVSIDILLMMLREQGFFEYKNIEYAILESTGNISILPAQATQSATKEDLVHGPDLSNEGQGPYTTLVVDGEIDKKNLHRRKKDYQWLNQQLHDLGASSIKEVIYLGMNSEGDIIADVHNPEEAEKKPDFGL